MRLVTTGVAAFLAAVVTAGFLEGGTASALPKDVETSRTELVPPIGSPARRAHGSIAVRGQADGSGRSVLTLRLRGLNPGARYTLLCDDPSTAAGTPTAFATIRARRDRAAFLRLDTARGDEMPHGAGAATLAGARFEVRDARGFLVLSGGVPDLGGPKALAEGCVFTEETIFTDNFDAATPGAAPPGWTITDSSVLVDSAVHDGPAGNSVQIADTDAVTAAPEMAQTFTAQDGFFAVEFTLIASATPGRVVFRLSQQAGGPAFATGLGDGLGLREDGTIGFVGGDSLGTYAANGVHKFRVDVDMAAHTFDVTLDGTQVVTAKDLGFADTTLDRISFGGAATTTGTANVDTVNVIHKTQNCKPIANAGTDQVVPATAPSTEVTLDGSASSDPEGAALTYTWTGDFTEGTASGALATVHFTTLGAHTVTLVVNDGVQDSDPDEVVIELIDVTPPTIVVENLPISLWPPNHDLVRILPAVQVTDDFDDNPDVTLDITSNEADDGRGDGSTTGDSFVRSPSDFDLRAERAGPGGGRIYKLVWTATDDSGNTSTLTKYVVVPHDNGHPLPQPPADEPPPAPQPIGGTTSSDAPGLGAGSVGAASGNQGNGNGRGRGHAYGRGGKKKKAH